MKKNLPVLLIICFAVCLAAATVWAWQEPLGTPPNSNVFPPINTSSTAQTKFGDLTLPNLWLNAVGNEGNIYNANIIQGFNDLILYSSTTKNAPIYLEGKPVIINNDAGTGNVGIGTTTAASLLTVGTAGGFQVNSSGNFVKINNVTTTWPAANISGVLTNNGSGALSWAAAGGSGTVTSISPGASGAETAGSGLTFSANPITTSGSISLSNTTVAAGTYGNSGANIPNITVDARGRLTAAANRALSPADIGAATAGHTHATLSQGTGITAFSYNGSAAATVGLTNTTVTAGNYTSANITVDAQGRITSASNGSAGTNYWTLNGTNDIYNNNSSGKVGIGYTSPAAKLAVGGVGGASDTIAAYATSVGSALYAEQNGTGYAGYFKGKEYVSSTLAVGTLVSCPNVKSDATGLLQCNNTSYLTSYSETDPKVGTLTAGQWCTTDGAKVNCTSSAPSGGAPVGATYITQTADSTLTAEQALSTLATGYMKVTNGTGVVSSQAVPIPVTDGGTGATSFTSGYVLFGNGTAAIGTDSGLYWDNTNKRLGILQASPGAKLAVNNPNTAGKVGSTGDAIYAYANSANSAISAEQAGTGYAGYFAGKLAIIEGGVSPTFNTSFQGGDQSASITYTLPAAQGLANTVLTNNGSGALSWSSAGGGLWTDQGTYIYPNNYTSFVVTDAGNVGIGTTTPSAKLQVYTSGIETGRFEGSNTWANWFHMGNTTVATPAWNIGVGGSTYTNPGAFVFDQDGGNARLVIANGGNVGIGTTGPDNKLDVNGVLEVGTGSRGVQLISSAPDNFTLMTQTNTPNTNWSIGSGNGSGGLDTGKPYIQNPGSTYLALMGGNVGIGTTGPSQKLDVNGNISASAFLGEQTTGVTTIAANLGSADGSWIELFGSSNGTRPGEVTIGSNGIGPVKFVNYNGTAWNELMRITNGGNVGIGTASPGSYKLNVAGDQYTSGNLTVGGQLITDTINSKSSGSVTMNIGDSNDTVNVQGNLTVGGTLNLSNSARCTPRQGSTVCNTIPINGVVSATSSCNDGEVMTSGGGGCDEDQWGEVFLFADEPVGNITGNNQWEAACVRTSGSGVACVTAWAYCCF